VHPLIAVAWVLASIGEVALSDGHHPILFEQISGPVETIVTVENGQPQQIQFTMMVDATIDRFVPQDNELAAILGLDIAELERRQLHPMLVCCGKNYLVIPIHDYTSVRKARFNFKEWSRPSAPSILRMSYFWWLQPNIKTKLIIMLGLSTLTWG